MVWRCGSFSFDLQRPIIMGILNMTPDSFSDGGSYPTLQDAVQRAHDMVAEGASIIDVGGESTRPGSSEVDPQEEWTRVGEVVEALSSEGIFVSIDTRHAEVARRAVCAGASVINDVSGFRDPAMVEVARQCEAGLVVMHMKGEPKTMQENPTYDDVVIDVRDYLRDRAAELQWAGIARERVCIDPGPGFGKTPRQTIDLMRNLHEIVRLGYPVMVAVSRKSYIGYAYHIDDPRDRDEASAQEALLACELGATVVRTHNVKATVAALKDLRPYVFLGLGSNVALVGGPEEDLEAKKAQIELGVARLALLPDTQLIDIASYYVSEPAYYTDQADFVNTVALLRTGLPPRELLDYLHAIENMLGRVREIENGPRTLDLDILDYQLYVCATPELTLPHPRICERDFVVKPFLELSPHHVLADGTLIGQVPEDERVGKAHRL